MPLLSEIVSFLKASGLKIIEPKVINDILIVGGKNISDASENEITFLSVKLIKESNALMNSSNSPLIIIDDSVFDSLEKRKFDKYIVLSSNAKSTIVSCLKNFFEEEITPSIHPTAIIDSTSFLGNNCFVGAYTLIEKNVSIGNNCIIESHVKIYSDVVIGNNVFIKSGTVIGGKGFGYVKSSDGKWENFPHFGKVIIENNVEIGSNTCIDRGALGDTIIKNGVKIDNLVHVAHNVFVGENSLLIADSMIGGSVKIGSNTWVAPSAVLRNGISIGSNCVIGMGAIVTKSVADEMTVAGNPAHPIQKKGE